MSETIANLRAEFHPWAWDAGVATLAATLGIGLGLLAYRVLFGVLRRIARSNEAKSDDIIKRAMARMPAALADAGLGHVKMLLQVHDELVFELPEGDVAAASPVIERTMAEAALPAVELDVPLGIEIGTGKNWDEAH